MKFGKYFNKKIDIQFKRKEDYLKTIRFIEDNYNCANINEFISENHWEIYKENMVLTFYYWPELLYGDVIHSKDEGYKVINFEDIKPIFEYATITRTFKFKGETL